jgi:MYXO-CTERM domain-containing protein
LLDATTQIFFHCAARSVLSKMSTVERKLIAFTIVGLSGLLATNPAQASHPQQTLQQDGNAKVREFVATASPTSGRGYRFARQVLTPSGAVTDQKAQSRTIYLNRDGAILFPGDNDSSEDTSSIVTEPVLVPGWDIDDETWDETVACVRDLYSRFDVDITDVDPGDVPHIEALFGGHPSDVGLPDDVAGVSPFTTDCSTIERSIVFTFTDVLPDDARLMCEVMAQEIAHSFGLDHQMTPSDPMTYLDYDGDRTFKNEMAVCGEFEGRDCGINGSVCRDGQNSVSVLTSRLGKRGAEDALPEVPTTTGPEAGGCASSGSGGPLGLGVVALALACMLRRQRKSRLCRGAQRREASRRNDQCSRGSNAGT